MMKNRCPFLLAAIIAAFLLTSCPAAQKKENSERPKAQTKAESPKDTQKDTRKGTQTVKGINDWEGEIIGKPAPGSKFTKLKIGMTMKQVTKLIGQPNDQGAYVTGKAWIPYYHGSDVYRHELVYKNQGRLIFASDPFRRLRYGKLDLDHPQCQGKWSPLRIINGEPALLFLTLKAQY